jgi:hypothetical protein
MDEYHSLVRETFVVRFWREATNLAWRGQIIHLPDQETAAFATWNQAEEIIRRFIPDLETRKRGADDEASG